MLSWVGKRPLREVRAYPAQLVERFDAGGEASRSVDWTDWPDRFDRGGLLFHGDNKEVLAHLLANGFRGKVDLVYIDPPFDSGADYVRRVQLRGASGTARLDGETYTLGEQIQYTDGRFGTRSWSTSRSTTATSPWRPSSRPRRRPRSIIMRVPGPWAVEAMARRRTAEHPTFGTVWVAAILSVAALLEQVQRAP
jgi:hypothetical protein